MQRFRDIKKKLDTVNHKYKPPLWSTKTSLRKLDKLEQGNEK
jgi:hypothetical protein